MKTSSMSMTAKVSEATWLLAGLLLRCPSSRSDLKEPVRELRTSLRLTRTMPILKFNSAPVSTYKSSKSSGTMSAMVFSSRFPSRVMRACSSINASELSTRRMTSCNNPRQKLLQWLLGHSNISSQLLFSNRYLTLIPCSAEALLRLLRTRRRLLRWVW